MSSGKTMESEYAIVDGKMLSGAASVYRFEIPGEDLKRLRLSDKLRTIDVFIDDDRVSPGAELSAVVLMPGPELAVMKNEDGTPMYVGNVLISYSSRNSPLSGILYLPPNSDSGERASAAYKASLARVV